MHRNPISNELGSSLDKSAERRRAETTISIRSLEVLIVELNNCDSGMSNRVRQFAAVIPSSRQIAGFGNKPFGGGIQWNSELLQLLGKTNHSMALEDYNCQNYKCAKIEIDQISDNRKVR